MILGEKGTILQVTEHGGTRSPSESDSGEAGSNCPPHSECGEASSPLPTQSGSGRVHPETPPSRLDLVTVHLESPSSPLPNPGSASGGRGPSPLAKEQPPLCAVIELFICTSLHLRSSSLGNEHAVFERQGGGIQDMILS